MQRIRELADHPIGLNMLTENSSKSSLDRTKARLDIALEEGVRFVVSSPGNPRWVVERVEHVGGIVSHDVTEREWALKAVEAGVPCLVGVNRSAGGRTGDRTAEALLDELGDLGLPVVCAGEISAAGASRAETDAAGPGPAARSAPTGR